jgi:hypothetical protein
MKTLSHRYTLHFRYAIEGTRIDAKAACITGYQRNNYWQPEMDKPALGHLAVPIYLAMIPLEIFVFVRGSGMNAIASALTKNDPVAIC